MTDSFVRGPAWAAYLNGATAAATLVTITLFFVLGGPWGRINDGVSVAWALSLLPLIRFFYRSDRPEVALAGPLALVGGGAALLFAGLQALLVLGLVSFTATFNAVLALNGLVGVWFVARGFRLRADGRLSAGLARLTLILGAGSLVGAAGLMAGGWQNPLGIAGFLVWALAAPLWGIWLGRLLGDGRLASPTAGKRIAPQTGQ